MSVALFTNLHETVFVIDFNYFSRNRGGGGGAAMEGYKVLVLVAF